MSVFGTLRDYLRSLTGKGDDDAPEPEKRAPEARPVARPVQRKSQGDGFDAGFGGARVDLSGGQRVPVLEVEERPVDASSFTLPSDFNASLDDLPALVDEPLGEQPEFIPEGGMSTQSLMREFEALDPGMVVAPSTLEEAVPGAEAVPATPATLAAGTPAVLAGGAAAETSAATSAADSAATPAPETSAAGRSAELSPPATSAEISAAASSPETFAGARSAETSAAATSDAAAAPAAPLAVGTPAFAPPPATQALPDALDLAEFATPDSTFAFAESSLAESAFESAPSAAVEPVAEPSSFDDSSFEPAAASTTLKKPARLTPAWLIEPTTPVARRPEVAQGAEFNASLDDLGLLVDESPAAEPEAPTTTSDPESKS